MRHARRLAIVANALAGALMLARCASTSEPVEDAVPLPPRTVAQDGAAAPAVDAARPGCDRTQPFGAPQLVPGLGSGVQYRGTPKLSQNELTIYFTTQIPTDAGDRAQLMFATRSSVDAPFGEPRFISELDSTNDDFDPAPSSDQLSLWFASTRSGTEDLWFATRPVPGATFDIPSLVRGVNTPASDLQPYYREDAGELWFVSDRSDAGLHLYTAKALGAPDAGFGGVSIVGELTSRDDDVQPAPTEDGLAVVFASDRAGGAGGYDLWIARRSSTSEPFGAPSAITSANTPMDEFAGWLSPDDCRVYFSSERDTDADAPVHRLWFVERPSR